MAESSETFSLLKLFPPDDAAFVALARALLAQLGDAEGPAELQRALRETYPLARVQVQERLGMNGALRPHWYVFRDGRITHSTAAPDLAGSGTSSR